MVDRPGFEPGASAFPDQAFPLEGFARAALFRAELPAHVLLYIIG